VAENQNFQGFFSYSQRDAELDPHLSEACTRLEERVNRKLSHARLTFWRDVQNLRTGQRWDHRIEEAVRSSQIFVVLMTPGWFESPSCQKEYQIFKQVEHAIDAGEYVVPIRSRDIDNRLPHFGPEQKAIYDDLNKRRYIRIISTEFLSLTNRQRNVLIDKIANDIEGMIERLAAKSAKNASDDGKVDTDLQQIPAAFKFRVQNDKIDVLPEPADVTDAGSAYDLYAELIAKATELRSRLAATNSDPRVQSSVDRLLEALAVRIEDIRPGVLLSRSRSIEADRNAFDTEDARRELFPDAVAMLDDVLLTLQDLLAVYPIVRKIEAERLALSIQRDAPRLAAVRAELEAIKKEVSASEAVTDAVVAALKENDPDIEAARTLDVLAGLVADQALVVRNFGSVAVNYARKHGASAGAALGEGLARIGSELKEVGGKSWEATKVNLPQGVGAAARILPVGFVIVLLAHIAGPVAGLAALAGGFKQLAKAINELKDIGEPPKASKPGSEAAKKPQPQRRHLFVVPETVDIPAGEFMMGSPGGEGDESERPQHKITIRRRFAIGIAPVTRGEFASFVEATDFETGESVGRSWRNPGFDQLDDHPVVFVSWHDAKAYVSWLKEESGKTYRLLSEAEWEFCCRAGTTTKFNTGDTISVNQANFDAKGTTSVSKFPPNPWDIHDMHGNVWEWCEDNWHVSYKGKPPTDGSVWRGGSKGFRVLRGGSWSDIPGILRSAIRSGIQPGGRIDYIGFRVARTL
jgi:formylglycine-generating enzyme required for sulfatase activity